VLFFRDDLNVYTWDPTAAIFEPRATPTDHRLFCSGHGMLADDRLLVVGGHNFGGIGSGHNRASLYDTVSNTWTPPGHYLLFILNGDGVPSIGAILRRPVTS
jgi:hypothetical protein